MIFFRMALLGLGFSLFNSCSHFAKNKEYTISHQESSSSQMYKSLSAPEQNLYGQIPMDSHPDVDKWIKYFTHSGYEYMKSYLERSSRYILLMKSVLKENKLPPNLVYVALIESGFSPKALSRANAVGYWQFIYGTGKRYGLRIDGFVDERRDPVLSTRAAVNYFKDLYSLFGSWHLALAAYNAGEYRVNRAVLRHYNRDFWFLSHKKALPRETRNYVPKLIAAISIAKNPKKYGFHDLDYQEPINYELIKVKQSISLVKLAQSLQQVTLEEIKSLNPMYKGEYVPVYEEETAIRVPVGYSILAQSVLDKIKMSRPKHSYHYHYWYRVRRGDSLYKIARRHKTTVRKIRKKNNMGLSSLIHVGQRLKIPTKRLIAVKQSSKKRAPAGKRQEFHRVKKGQTLSRIAKKHSLTLAQLKKLNNIQGNPIIHPGQKLRIAEALKPKKAYHTVKKGETLIEIAKKHNIPLPKLMRANSMSFKSVLLTGARLIIPK